ncbi:MAG: hypothetical protein JSR70_08815, partial [Proteobacteria bacterium]|nr:hypothetical protein [Pseudomonadota bacterium]
MDDTELDRLAWLLVSGQETAEDVIDPAMDADTLEERALCHVYRVAILPHISEPKELFEALQRIWLEANSSRSNNYHGRALARAHNASEFNGPQLAVAAIEQGGDLFTVIRMLAEALPLFDEIETADIIQFFEVAYPRIKNDLANGIPYNALEQWLIRHPNAVEPVVSACLEAPSAALAVLLRIALVRSVVGQSAEALNRVHALRSNESKFISLPAIEALGLIEWAHFDRSEVDRAVVALREGLTSSEEDTVFSSALSALWLLNHSPGDHVLIDEIVALDMPFVVRLVGDHLAYRADAIRQHSWYPDKVTLLAGKMGQHPDSYHGVDHILSERFQDTTVSWDPIPWLDAWVGTRAEISEYEKAFPRVFPQLFAALCRRPENLCELVIHWLLQSDLGIQRAARDILSELNHIQYAGVRVPQKMLDSMNAPELVHLVRRILGNVFNDGQLVSLIWSLTD